MKAKQTRLSIPSARTHAGLIRTGLLASLVLVSQVNAQTASVAGSAAAPTALTVPSGSVEGTFLDLSLSGSWDAGLPSSSTDATITTGFAGISDSAGHSVKSLTLQSDANLHGGNYNGSGLTAGTMRTVTVGAGGMKLTSATIGQNITIAVGSNDQTWELAGGSTKGQITGNAEITTKAGSSWQLRNGFTTNGFTGTWNLVDTDLRMDRANALGESSATVVLSSGSSIRIDNSSTAEQNFTIGSGGAILRSIQNTIFSGAFDGAGDLSLTGDAGDNITFTGDMSDHTGRVNVGGSVAATFSDTSVFSFTIGGNGFVDGFDTSGASANALIRGTSAANFNGVFSLDLTTLANLTDGNTWQLVDVLGLTETYGSTFKVASNIGDFTEVSDVWTRVDGNNTWTFEESSGTLDLAVIPELSTRTLLLGFFAFAFVARRRRTL
jgi:hypothetical protein